MRSISSAGHAKSYEARSRRVRRDLDGRPEDDSPAAPVLREDYRNKIHDLISPDSLPIEVAHALTRAERQGKINPGRAEILFADLLDPCPPLYPYFDYIDRAMQFSSKLRIGVFDCVDVALAEEQECHVVTSDKRLSELFPSLTILLSSL